MAQLSYTRRYFPSRRTGSAPSPHTPGSAPPTLQWFGPPILVCSPCRFSGTAHRPRPWPLRAGPIAPAQPPPLSLGRGGSRMAVPAWRALVVRTSTALRGTRTRPSRGATGGAQGHAPAHSPVTGGRPASLEGLYSRPSPRCAWSHSLCFLVAATAAAAATPSQSQAQRLSRRGPPSPPLSLAPAYRPLPPSGRKYRLLQPQTGTDVKDRAMHSEGTRAQAQGMGGGGLRAGRLRA